MIYSSFTVLLANTPVNMRIWKYGNFPNSLLTFYLCLSIVVLPRRSNHELSGL